MFWLVVDLPLWKMMEESSVGIMTFPIVMESHQIPWVQTTNQMLVHSWLYSSSTFQLLTPRNNHPMTADRGSCVMVTHKALLLGPTRLGGAGSTILGNSLARVVIPWNQGESQRIMGDGCINLDLVGGWKAILKNDGVRQWEGLIIPYMKWKIKTCLKPPTSYFSLWKWIDDHPQWPSAIMGISSNSWPRHGDVSWKI